MNTQTTVEKLKSMRLKGMAQTHFAYSENNLYQGNTLEQYTALLTDQELDSRQNRKICNLTKGAPFRLNEFNKTTRQALMDIVEYKYETASLIVTSQYPVNKWHELIGQGTIADAILDRLIHSSHRINLKGESMSKAKAINR